jgi:hypothetical protein
MPGVRVPAAARPGPPLLGCWDQLVDQVCTNHYRKTGFIREFEKVAASLTPEPEPTFLGKARARRAPPD